MALPLAAALQAVAVAPSLWLVACAVLLAGALYRQWKLRHIPGPSPWYVPPVLGDLPEILRVGAPPMVLARARRLGPIFRVNIGRSMWVALTEPDHVRVVGYRSISRIFQRTLLRGELRFLIDNDILTTGDDELWRVLRGAWQPAFSPATLRGYLPLMVRSADALAALLAARAPKAEALELHDALGRMTLQVVGSCAFGVDFHCFDEGGGDGAHRQQAGAGDEGMALTQACRDIFATISLRGGSRWQRLSAMLPELRPVISVLANTFPDERFRVMIKARNQLLKTARSLIDDWHLHHKLSEPSAGDSGNGERVDDSAPSSQAPASPSGTPSHAHGAPSGVSSQQPGGNGGGPSTQQSPAQSFSLRGESAVSGPVREEAVGCAASAYVPHAPPPLQQLRGSGSARQRGLSSVAPGSFLDVLLAARKRQAHGQPLNDLQIIAQAQVFILAGYETTANALAFAVHAISSHPEVEQKLLAEIDAVLTGAGADKPLDEEVLAKMAYMDAVCNESMRVTPSVAATVRKLREDTAVGGYTLPAGTTCLLSLYALQRSEEVWGSDALTFRPERFLGEGGGPPVPCSFLPFGLGPRMCIGYKFAQMEMKVALVQLYRRLTFKLAPGQVPIQITFGLTASPKGGVLVTPMLRETPV